MINSLNNKLAVIFLLCAAVSALQVKHTRAVDDGVRVPRGPSFECLNGKDPATLNKKQILAEFARGKCAPVILVPGLLSTKIVVEITNCEKLKEEFPDLFQACGFSRCSRVDEPTGPFEKGVPASEYSIWIPDILSPMTIFTYKESANYCFAKFVKQNIDFSKPQEEAIVENDAFKLRLWGNTPGTRNLFMCGDGATQNLLPLGSHFQRKETRAFLAMHTLLREKGYVAGLTYQTLPYNFLKSYRSGEVNRSFKEALTRLHALSNKKVVLVGHSMGNMNILHQLNKLPLEDKARMVKVWIAAGPPFLGSIKMNKTLLSGEDDLIFLRNILGLHLRPGLEGLCNAQTSFVLTIKDPFAFYKGAKWFEAVEKRIKYETKEAATDESGLAFLPKLTDQCSPAQYTTFSKNCTLGLYDTRSQPMVKIMNETFFMNETDRMHDRWNSTENMTRFLQHVRDPDYMRLENPGVPLVLVMVRTQPTIKTLSYKLNITNFIMKNVYYYPDIETHYGDGTVPSFSMVIPPLKWAWEFDNKAVPGAQPVKIVDMCSTYNPRHSPYDSQDEKGVNGITKNEFFGISCECMRARNPHPCAHASMISDAGYLDMLAHTLEGGESTLTEEHQRFIDGLTEEYLTEVSVDCPSVKF